MREFINEAIETSQDDTLLESYDKEMALYDCAFSIGEESGQRRGEEIGRQIIIKKLLEGGYDKSKLENVLGISLD